MADFQLQKLKRAHHQEGSVASGRALYQAMFRYGQKDEALNLRASLGYAEEIRALPRPTKQQCRDFAEYVAGAHSWYKHLDRGGEPFFFYLAPWAGRTENGNMFLKENCWHYNHLPTEEHLERFGHWLYSRYEPPTKVHAECGVELALPEEFHFSALWTPDIHEAQWPLPDYQKTYKPKPEETADTASYLRSMRNRNAAALWGLRAAWKAMDGFLSQLNTV